MREMRGRELEFEFEFLSPAEAAQNAESGEVVLLLLLLYMAALPPHTEKTPAPLA